MKLGKIAVQLQLGYLLGIVVIRDEERTTRKIQSLARASLASLVPLRLYLSIASQRKRTQSVSSVFFVR
jgi:hypothetical protein